MMKKYILNKRFYTLIMLLALLVSCEDFEEMNQNPSTSTNMDPNIMLPTIQMQLTGGRFETWRNGFIYSASWMQHWGGEYASRENGGKGKKNEQYNDALWVTQYPREVKNIVDMINRTQDDPELVNINAVSRIMKVYIFSRLTDLYGDLPYFEAGAGYNSGVLMPKYDRQEEIYNDFFKELEAAVSALDPSRDLITHDIYYNGNISKWKKFGNSLRLRLAMRLTKVNINKAKEEAEKAISGGTMENNSDMTIMKHINTPFNEGVYGGNALAYTFMTGTLEESTSRIGRTFAKYLDDTGDPRISLYGGSYLKDENRTNITEEVYAELGSYADMGLSTLSIGEEPGGTIQIQLPGETEPTDVTRSFQLMQPSKYISTFDAPYIIMSYTEVELLKAEAAFRGWAAEGSATDHFENALRAGVAQMEVYKAPMPSQAEIDNFVAANPLTPGNELVDINYQLWVNFALNGQEAFANWRRTGIPNLVFPNPVPAENQTNGEIPRRMQYPITEYQLNKANLDEAVAREPLSGKDDWMERVWWDK